MTLFVCLDDQDGMSFGGRRQSRDSAVIKDIFATANGASLTVAPYSKLLLSQYGSLTVTETPMKDAESDGFVFIEVESPREYTKRIDRLIIYRWGEIYPADIRLDILPSKLGLSLLTRRYLVGTSHKKITKEVYTK